MKKFVRTFAFLLAALMSASFFYMVPAKADTSVPDPRITAMTVDPAEPGLGSPFGVTLDFEHDCESNIIKPNNPSFDHVIVKVTSETDAISVGQKEYRIQGSDNTDSNADNNFDSASYTLYIPQKNLKRVGKGYGILKLEITYYENESKSNDSKITFADSNNNNKVSTFTVEKLVFGKLNDDGKGKTGANLSVQSYKIDPEAVKEGSKFSLTFTVKNNSNIPCNHVQSVVTPPDGISVNGKTNTQYLGTLAAGGTADVTYPLSCLPKMVTGSYVVKIALSADEFTASADPPEVFIPITGTKTDEKDTGKVGDSKPQIIISSYDYGGKAVTGGKEFTLSMNIKNTGAAPIENIKMTVSSAAGTGTSDKDTGGTGGAEGAFTPSKSSNTFFIKKLGANSVINEKISLLPKSDAAPNSYGVNIAFSYEAVVDKKRQSIDATETVAIPLTQPDRFEVNDVEVENPCYVGQAGQFTASYVNKGKSKIFNLSVKLEGNFSTGNKNTYIGNVDSGGSDDFEVSITPAKEGTLSGTVTFSYEDSAGNVKEIKKEFSGEVEAAQDMKGDMGGPNDAAAAAAAAKAAKKGGINWKIWVGGAAGAIVIIIVVRKLIKKRKAKNLRKLEESDDYDDEPGGGNGK